jgi:leucyl-tRNA synthetase
MSKSLGNIIPLSSLVEDVGADLVRANIVASNEETNDADWRDESVSSYEARLQMLFDIVGELKKKQAKRKSLESIDRYLASKVQQHIQRATQFYEQMKFRSSTQVALFELTNDIKWYVERCGGIGIANCNAQILSDALSACVRLISPVMPHVTEELWSLLGNKSFVSIEKWPASDAAKIDKNATDMEDILKRTLDDLRNVVKITNRNDVAYLYLLTDKEFNHFKGSEDFIRHQVGFKKVAIYKVTDADKYDPQNKSAKAKFGKPGIFVE